jgi:hypothetical protein
LQYKQIFIKALDFLTGTPGAPQSPELTDSSIYQINLPIIELAEVNIMGSEKKNFVWILNWQKLLVILVFLRHYHSKNATLC